MKKIVCLFSLIALLSLVALADVRIPTPKATPKGKLVKMVVALDDDVNEPTLVIKKSAVKTLRAALDEAEAGDDNLAQAETSSEKLPVKTIFAGIFLTLSFIFGGVWLARSKPSKTVIGLFLFGLFATTTVFVFADVAPPKILGITKRILSQDLQEQGFVEGKVRLKIVSDIRTDFGLLIPEKETNPNEEE